MIRQIRKRWFLLIPLAFFALIVFVPLGWDWLHPVPHPAFLTHEPVAAGDGHVVPFQSYSSTRLRALIDDTFTSDALRLRGHSELDAITSASIALGPPPWTPEKIKKYLLPLAESIDVLGATIHSAFDERYFIGANPDLEAWARQSAAIHRELDPFVRQAAQALIVHNLNEKHFVFAADVADETLDDPQLALYCRQRLDWDQRIGLTLADAVVKYSPDKWSRNFGEHMNFFPVDWLFSSKIRRTLPNKRFNRIAHGSHIAGDKRLHNFRAEFFDDQIIVHSKVLDQIIDFIPRQNPHRFQALIDQGPWLDEPDRLIELL